MNQLSVESLWIGEILPFLTAGACLPLSETSRWGRAVVELFFTRSKKRLRRVVEMRFKRRQKLPLLCHSRCGPFVSVVHVCFVSDHEEDDDADTWSWKRWMDASDWRLEIYPATLRRFQRFLATVPQEIGVECSVRGVLPAVHPFTAASFYETVAQRLLPRHQA